MQIHLSINVCFCACAMCLCMRMRVCRYVYICTLEKCPKRKSEKPSQNPVLTPEGLTADSGHSRTQQEGSGLIRGSPSILNQILEALPDAPEGLLSPCTGRTSIYSRSTLCLTSFYPRFVLGQSFGRIFDFPMNPSALPPSPSALPFPPP